MGWARFDLWSLCHSCQCVAHTGAKSQQVRGQQPLVVLLWERGLLREAAFRVWMGMAPIVQWTFSPQLMALFWKVIEAFHYKDKKLRVYKWFPGRNCVITVNWCYNEPQKQPFSLLCFYIMRDYVTLFPERCEQVSQAGNWWQTKESTAKSIPINQRVLFCLLPGDGWRVPQRSNDKSIAAKS